MIDECNKTYRVIKCKYSAAEFSVFQQLHGFWPGHVKLSDGRGCDDLKETFKRQSNVVIIIKTVTQFVMGSAPTQESPLSAPPPVHHVLRR